MKFITIEDSSEMVGTRQNHLLCGEMMDAFGSDKWVYSDLLRIIYHPRLSLSLVRGGGLHSKDLIIMQVYSRGSQIEIVGLNNIIEIVSADSCFS